MPSTSGHSLSLNTRAISGNQQGIFSSSLLSVGSSLKTVGNRAGRGIFHAVAAGYDHLTSDHSGKEPVLFAKFSELEWRGAVGLQQQDVLLLGYETGFQVWDLRDCTQIQELVSKRDGPVRCITMSALTVAQVYCAADLRHIRPRSLTLMHICLAAFWSRFPAQTRHLLVSVPCTIAHPCWHLYLHHPCSLLQQTPSQATAYNCTPCAVTHTYTPSASTAQS